MVQVVPPVGWKRGSPPEPETGIRPKVSGSLSVAPGPLPEKIKAAAVPPVLPPRVLIEMPPVVAAASSPAPIEFPQQVAVAPLVAKAVARMKQDWLLLSGGLAAGVVLGICAWLFALATGEPSVAVVATEGSLAAATPSASVSPATKNVDPQTDDSEPEETVEAPLPEAQPEPWREAVGANIETAPDDSETTVEQQPIVEDPPPASNATAAAPALEKPPSSLIKLDPVPKPVAGIKPAAKEAESTETSVDHEDPQDGAAAQPMPAKARSGVDDGAGLPTRVFSRTEIDERLATPLPTVQFVKVPLAQFTDFIAELTGLPITLDAAALAGAGRTRQTPVTVKLSNTTAADALRSALKSLGLSCSVGDDGQIVVAADESRRAKK